MEVFGGSQPFETQRFLAAYRSVHEPTFNPRDFHCGIRKRETPSVGSTGRRLQGWDTNSTLTRGIAGGNMKLIHTQLAVELKATLKLLEYSHLA